MPYVNLSETVLEPVLKYINESWVYSDANFFDRHILARGGFLVLTPFSAITSALDTIIGVGAGLATIVIGGMHKPTFKFAFNHLESSKTIVAGSYISLLRSLNPKAGLSKTSSHAGAILAERNFVKVENPLISCEGNGFITHYVNDFWKNIARSCYSSKNLFVRHIASRLTYVLLAVSSVVARIADGIIGVGAGILSFLPLGKVKSINNLAYRALQAPGIVHDLLYCTTKFINPWAGIPKPEKIVYD